ncbi:tetratricopeptide repeat protein [Vulgatibacter incomptus]|uniref:TPR domain protein, putative component of TonB system n=1 Tax=Vulgatibacter incomptus TaxID=1391653 RepID=A0A0K1P8T0_9BACT|nr:tetratricopeptide repeat protein [Vulgatibacter incomptus]AKU89938.1 TPR domain protein, putative component of TonB system [Vulgatibacter incomptus]
MPKLFLLAAASLLLAATGCRTISDKDRKLAASHLDIAQQSVAGGDPRAALAEVEKAVALDPTDPKSHNLYALLLHIYFAEGDRAILEYRKAIELDRDYTEAKVNLSAVYMATGRCADAIPLLEEARRDLLFREPYLVENNLGWCRYKLGDVDGALRHLRAAVSVNPGFCLGYRNLGEIMEEQGRVDEALRFVERYGKSCPEVADADFRRGLLLLEKGQDSEARLAFLSCKEKAKDDELAVECAGHAERIPGG